MKVTYLGTGAAEGMPATFCSCPVCLRSSLQGGKSLRMRSCTLLGDDILIDMGPDIHAQKLRFDLRLNQIKAIVYTHSHEDHLDLFALQNYGTPSCTVKPEAYGQNASLRLYGNKWVHRRFFRALSQGERMDSARFSFCEVQPWTTFQVQQYTFHALRANHRPIYVEDCLIYAITDGDKSMLYANDTGELSKDVDQYIKETGFSFSLVSMDCARGLLPGDGHMGWKQCLSFRERLFAINAANSSTRFILNHLSHMNDMTHSQWQSFARQEGIQVAWDGMVVEF